MKYVISILSLVLLSACQGGGGSGGGGEIRIQANNPTPTPTPTIHTYWFEVKVTGPDVTGQLSDGSYNVHNTNLVMNIDSLDLTQTVTANWQNGGGAAGYILGNTSQANGFTNYRAHGTFYLEASDGSPERNTLEVILYKDGVPIVDHTATDGNTIDITD